MVLTSKEGGQNIGLAGRGKYTSMKPKNKWRRRNYVRRNDMIGNAASLVMQSGGYEPPRLTDLQRQNKLKTKTFYPRKDRAPRAPRNTSSFIMRAKRSGGLPSLVSPVTPAILPTPVQSPAPRYRREGLVDEVNKEWGVDGYGSMNGLIRLRSMDEGDKFDSGFGTGESESDLEQDSHAESVQQLEQRIDHGLSRFEIVYPSPSAANGSKPLDARMAELEKRVADLEDENLLLKEKMYLLQQELAEAQRTVHLQDRGDDGSDENGGVSSGKSVVDTSRTQT